MTARSGRTGARFGKRSAAGPPRPAAEPAYTRPVSVQPARADQAEFLALFEASRADLRAFIRAVVPDRALRDDILQEVSAALWKYFDQYDRSRPFAPWARTVTARLIVHNLKSRQKTSRLVELLPPDVIELMAGTEDVVAEGDPRWDMELLKRCLGQLPERSQRLVQLRYREGLKLEEMAAQLGSTADAVRMALNRLRLRLARCLTKSRRKMAARPEVE